MIKLAISLLAAIGAFVVTLLSICIICGNLSIECKWYQWVANILFIAFAWALVWCQMDA